MRTLQRRRFEELTDDPKDMWDECVEKEELVDQLSFIEISL